MAAALLRPDGERRGGEPAHEHVVDSRRRARRQPGSSSRLSAPQVEVAREHAREAVRELGDEALGPDDLGGHELGMAEVVRGVEVRDDEPLEPDGVAPPRLAPPRSVDPSMMA